MYQPGHSFAHRRCAAALICVAGLLGSVVAGIGVAPRAGAATTISVDDVVQGNGVDQFDYVGSGWGHASSEGAPANPYDGTNAISTGTDPAGRPSPTASATTTGCRSTFGAFGDLFEGV